MSSHVTQRQIYFDAQDERGNLEDFRVRYQVNIAPSSFYRIKKKFREMGTAVYVVPIDIDSVVEVDAYQHIPQRLRNHPDLVVMNKQMCRMSAESFAQKYHVAKFALKHLRKFFVEHGYCWFLLPKNTKISVMASMFDNGINKQILRNFSHIQDLTPEQEQQLRKQYRVAGEYNDADNMVLLDKSYIALGAQLCADVLNIAYPTIATAFDRVFQTGMPTFVSLIGDKRCARKRTVRTLAGGGFPQDIPLEEILRTVEIGVATILSKKHALFDDAKSYVVGELLERAGHEKFQHPEWRVVVAQTSTKDFLRKYVDAYEQESAFAEIYDRFDADAHIIGWSPLPQIKEVFIYNILDQIRRKNYFWEQSWQDDMIFMEEFLRYGAISIVHNSVSNKDIEEDFARVRKIIKKNKIAQFYGLVQNVEWENQLNQELLTALIDWFNS